jgi:hypothetical protein
MSVTGGGGGGAGAIAESPILVNFLSPGLCGPWRVGGAGGGLGRWLGEGAVRGAVLARCLSRTSFKTGAGSVGRGGRGREQKPEGGGGRDVA